MRWRKVAMAMAVMPLLFACAYWANMLGDPVKESNFERIRTGMTKRQAEAILGNRNLDCPFAYEKWPENQGDPKQWIGDEYSIIVWFEHNIVTDKAESRWAPMKTWEERRTIEKILRFLRIENGPPRWAVKYCDDPVN